MNPITYLWLLINPRVRKDAGVALGALALLIGAFAAGYYTHKPADRVEVQFKDKIVEKIVEVEKKDTTTKKHVSRDVRIVRNKDGSEVITSHTETGSNTKIKDTTNTAKSETETKSKTTVTTTSSGPNWLIGPTVGFNAHNIGIHGLSINPGALTVGGEVDRRIIGPIWAGVYGQSSGEFGLSLKMSF